MRLFSRIIVDIRAQWTGSDQSRHERRKARATKGRKNTTGKFWGGTCHTAAELKAKKIDRYCAGKAGEI